MKSKRKIERTNANLLWGIITRLGIPIGGGVFVIFLKISPLGTFICPEPAFTPGCVQVSNYLFGLLTTLGIMAVQGVYNLFSRDDQSTDEFHVKGK